MVLKHRKSYERELPEGAAHGIFGHYERTLEMIKDRFPELREEHQHELALLTLEVVFKQGSDEQRHQLQVTRTMLQLANWIAPLILGLAAILKN